MIDLHCHTNISDSNLSIEEVIREAKDKGIDYLSITDHDTTIGIDEAVKTGKIYNVCIIPGVELSCYDYVNNKKVHILGYNIDYKKNIINNFCRELLVIRHNISGKIISILKDNGYDITVNEVSEYAKYGTAIYKQHIMHCLMDKGYCDGIYSDLYYRLFSKDYKGRAGECYIPVDYPGYEEGIKIILEAGGVPVLAHPGAYDNYCIIPKIADIGLKGIEKYHPLHNCLDFKKIDHYCDKYNLLQTGGSDYHGLYGSGIEKFGFYNTSKDNLDKIFKDTASC